MSIIPAISQFKKRTTRQRVVRRYPQVKVLRNFYLKLLKDERWQFRQDAQITEAYLHQIYGGWSIASCELSLRIERASNGRIRLADLRHDLSTRSSIMHCDGPNLTVEYGFQAI